MQMAGPSQNHIISKTFARIIAGLQKKEGRSVMKVTVMGEGNLRD